MARHWHEDCTYILYEIEAVSAREKKEIRINFKKGPVYL